jgi:hypothetical protein
MATLTAVPFLLALLKYYAIAVDRLHNANGPNYRKLRVKVMECAGLIGTSLM